jgi:hypothetical protein
MKEILMLLFCCGTLVMQAQTVSVKNGPSEKPQKHTDQYFCGYYGKDYGLENKSRHVWIDAKYEGGNVFEVYTQPLRGGKEKTVYTVNKAGEKWLTTDATPVMSVCLDQCENGRYLSHLGNNSGTMDFSGISEMFIDPTEIRAYIATGHTAGGRLELAERTKLPKGQGFVMQGNSPGWYQIPVTNESVSAGDFKDNQFKFSKEGSVAQTTDKTLFSLTKKGVFMRVKNSVPAFTPYYKMKDGKLQAFEMLLLDFDSATTGIDDAMIVDDNDSKPDMNSTMYLLSGQRVKNPRRGTIVVQNGAKYMIK